MEEEKETEKAGLQLTLRMASVGDKQTSIQEGQKTLQKHFMDFHRVLEKLSENESHIFKCCNSRCSSSKKTSSLQQQLTERIHMLRELLYLMDKIQTQDPELKVIVSEYCEKFEHTLQQLHLLHYEKQQFGLWGMDQDVYDEDILLQNFTEQLGAMGKIERGELKKLLHQLLEALHTIVIKELLRKNIVLKQGEQQATARAMGIDPPLGAPVKVGGTSKSCQLANEISGAEERGGACGQQETEALYLSGYASNVTDPPLGAPEKVGGTSKSCSLANEIGGAEERGGACEEEDTAELYLARYSTNVMGSGASSKQNTQRSTVYQYNQESHQQQSQHPLGLPRNDGSYQFHHAPGALPYPQQDHESFPTPQLPPNKQEVEKKGTESSDEDEITKTTNENGWSYEKDRIYMMVLSAEEFLGQMLETDQRIRTISQACERELHRKNIEEQLGLRGHLQDELLRIEQMLAKNDPKLRSLNSFEQSFPHVVAKLRELRRKEAIVQAKVIQEELPPSSEETETQATGTSTTSAGTQSGSSTTSSQGVQSGAASNPEVLKQRHRDEEKKVAENYADRFVKNSELSPDDVERLLQDHALSMQALRQRQAGERDSMKERMRLKLRNKLKKDNYKGGKEEEVENNNTASSQSPVKKMTAVVTSEDQETSETETKLNGKESGNDSTTTKPNHVAPPTSMYGNYEDDDSDDPDSGGVLADTLWNKMKLTHRMTAEHMKEMVKTVAQQTPEEPDTFDSVVSKYTSGDEQTEDHSRQDEELVAELIKRNRAQMTEAEFAAFLDEYLHDRDSLRRYKAQRRAELDAKLRSKLDGKKKKKHEGSAESNGSAEYDGNESDGNSGDFETGSQNSGTGSVAASQDEELDEETLKELKELKADLQEHMGANRNDLSEEDVKRMLALYRKRQQEIIASRRETRERHNDKLKEKLKKRTKYKQSKASKKEQSNNQDDAFFQRLMVRYESGELSKDEFSEMLREHMNRKRDEERQKRKELRKRDTEVDKMAAFKMVDSFRKDKQELHKVRKSERSKIDEKLQKKLQLKKKERENSGLSALGDSSMSNNAAVVDSSGNDSSSLFNGTS